MQNDTCLATYEGHPRAVWDVQVTGKTLVASGADGTVRFWDIETTLPLHVINLVSWVALTVKGSRNMTTWNMPSLERIPSFAQDRQRTSCCAFLVSNLNSDSSSRVRYRYSLPTSGDTPKHRARQILKCFVCMMFLRPITFYSTKRSCSAFASAHW